MIHAITELTSKDLFMLFAGSGVTILLYFLSVLREFQKNYKSLTPLIGTWHGYHYSRVNRNTVFRSEKWNIKRRLLWLKITITDQNRPELKYRGTIKFDGIHITLNFEGIGHEEIMHYRLSKPIPNEDTLMIGFHVSKDFDQEMYASTKLLTKLKRREEQAKETLHRSFEWHDKEQAIRLSKAPIELTEQVTGEEF